jgi:hypothetical protein
MIKRRWTDEQLISNVKACKSYRQVLIGLKLRPTGGNYKQIQKYIRRLHLSIAHFTGKGWNVGMHFKIKEKIPLDKILIKNSTYQSFLLRNRLFKEGFKAKRCEECGWAKISEDGRLPLELDHINGDHNDNRLENLRILCPNCHSLKPNHRGSNKRKY